MVASFPNGANVSAAEGIGNMVYVYTECDGNVRIFRCDDRKTGSVIAKSLLADNPDFISHDVAIVTISLRRLRSEITRPYLDAGGDYGDVRDAVDTWLAGTDVVPNADAAIRVGRGEQLNGNWWFGMEDSRGDTNIYHPGV